MSDVPSLDALSAIDPRSEPSWLRSGLRARHEAGLDCGPVLAALGASDPVALAELLVGPRADGALVPLALQVAPVLEDALSAPALYRRLADLAGDDHETLRLLVQHLVASHPTKTWVVTLCRRVPLPGTVQHLLSREDASTSETCASPTRSGASTTALWSAVALRRPFGALAATNNRGALVDAAVAVLRTRPDVSVAAWLAQRGVRPRSPAAGRRRAGGWSAGGSACAMFGAMSTPTYSRVGDGASGLFAEVDPAASSRSTPTLQTRLGRVASVDEASVRALSHRPHPAAGGGPDRVETVSWETALEEIGASLRSLRASLELRAGPTSGPCPAVHTRPRNGTRVRRRCGDPPPVQRAVARLGPRSWQPS